jgi:hypothetical protein
MKTTIKGVVTNQERADRCEVALRRYGNAHSSLYACLVAFLADARHWCDQHGESFAVVDRTAYLHYLAEIHPVSGDEP